MQRTLALLMALGVALLLVRLAPRPPLSAQLPLSQVIEDASGKPLRLRLAADGQVRVWTPLSQLPAPLIDAVLFYEDRRFYAHPGVDALALGRALIAPFHGAPKQGASTISMQLARLLHPTDSTRSVGGKLRQMLRALWLEARYGKREILEAYLNAAPYGGNLSGVGTAARFALGKPASALDLAEITALAVLPQSPRARRLIGAESPALRRARLALFARWQIVQPTLRTQAAIVSRPLHGQRLALPFAAAHLSAELLALNRPEFVLRSTLDLPLQQRLERRLSEHLRPLTARGVRNASVLLVDSRDMAVKALLGSAQFANGLIHGQVDGTRAMRSPGSTLKPFLYGLALDQGLIHPDSVLKDEPSWFGAYAPENADGRFVGPITAREALIRSRNLPAVALAARLQKPSLYQFLKAAQLRLPFTESHYGLALTLGGGEVTARELATLYAMLANDGQWRPLRFLASDPVLEGTPLLSPEAAFLVQDMLKDSPAPGQTLYRPARERLAPAWKTGTSWGFRDAWTAGIVGPYVLVVWVGEFDGRSNPQFAGITTAAPLFFAMVDALRAAEPGLSDSLTAPPKNLARVRLCTASGQLPNADCPQTHLGWFIPGKSPITVSTLHRKVVIDTRSGDEACTHTPPSARIEQVFEYWPSDLARLFSQAGLPRARPPAPCPTQAVHISARNRHSPPYITSPLRGVEYPYRSQELGQKPIPLTAHSAGGVRQLHWFANQRYLGTTPTGTALAFIPPQPGDYALRVEDDQGGQDQRSVRVTVLGE